MRTIEEILRAKSLAELEDLGFRLLVDPPENRGSKAAWVAITEEAILNAPADKLRQILMPEEWDCLKKASVQSEEDADAWIISAAMLRREPELVDAIERLSRFGLAYRTRQQAVILPQGVTLAVCESDEALDAASLQRMTDGLLRLVGCAPLTELGKMVKNPNEGTAKAKKRKKEGLPDWVLESMVQLWQLRAGMSGISLLDGNDVWLVAEQCTDPVPVLRSQIYGKGKTLQYPRMTPDEAVELSLRGNPVSDEKLAPVRNLMLRQGVDEDTVSEVLNQATVLMQLNRDTEAMTRLGECIPDTPSPATLRLLTEYWSSIPMWGLKGHTDAEIHPARLPDKPHARPDGRCSCGSGRTYSRCCGRLN